MLNKSIKLKKLIAYRTNKQYFSITNLIMLKKFEKFIKASKKKFLQP